MILSVFLTLAVAAVAMTPGWLLWIGRDERAGTLCASMVASLTTALLVTALIGALAGILGSSLPSSTLLIVSFGGVLFAGLKRGKLPQKLSKVLPEWPGLGVSAVLVSFGLFSISSAFSESANGDLLVHAWYNADWFKHMGHVHALTNFGVPAKDLFGNGEPLHYYWLFYLWPGAASTLGADPWIALSTANGLISAMLGYLLYSLVRSTGFSSYGSLVLTVAAMVLLAPHGFFVWFVNGGTLDAFLSSGLAPAGSGLLATSQVIPQHALATAIFCSWFILSHPLSNDWQNSPSVGSPLFSLVALASLMAVSTMLGAIYLLAYGLARLVSGRMRAVPELTLMVAASIGVVIFLEVLKLGNPASAIESPLLIDEELGLPSWRLAIAGLMKAVGFVGLPLFVLVAFLGRFRPSTTQEKHAFIICLAIFAAGAIAVVASQVLLPARPAAEIFVRTKIPFSIAVMVLGAMIVRSFWSRSRNHRIGIISAFGALAIVSTPSIYAFAIWQSNFGDGFTTTVPKADRMALATLRDESASDAVVWQYPEKPLLGDPAGGDNWSAIFAGRLVPNSERATDYATTAPMIETSQNWFAGEGGDIPQRVDWIYLSEALHPESFEALVIQMRADPAFEEAGCFEDAACIYKRRSDGE